MSPYPELAAPYILAWFMVVLEYEPMLARLLCKDMWDKSCMVWKNWVVEANDKMVSKASGRWSPGKLLVTFICNQRLSA